MLSNLSAHSNPAYLVLAAMLCALLPVAIALLTSYLKVSIVLGIIRNAIGTQHAPGAMTCAALSLVISALVMAPVFNKSKGILDSGQAVLRPDLTLEEALVSARVLFEPWQAFLRAHTGSREISSLKEATESRDENLAILITAFILTELKQGFCMAFIVLLPFLAIDLIVANILMGMGMMMVSPVLISLPLKIILFVISDAWILIVQGLIRSYGVNI